MNLHFDPPLVQRFYAVGTSGVQCTDPFPDSMSIHAGLSFYGGLYVRTERMVFERPVYKSVENVFLWYFYEDRRTVGGWRASNRTDDIGTDSQQQGFFLKTGSFNRVATLLEEIRKQGANSGTADLITTIDPSQGGLSTASGPRITAFSEERFAGELYIDNVDFGWHEPYVEKDGSIEKVEVKLSGRYIKECGVFMYGRPVYVLATSTTKFVEARLFWAPATAEGCANAVVGRCKGPGWRIAIKSSTGELVEVVFGSSIDGRPLTELQKDHTWETYTLNDALQRDASSRTWDYPSAETGNTLRFLTVTVTNCSITDKKCMLYGATFAPCISDTLPFNHIRISNNGSTIVGGWNVDEIRAYNKAGIELSGNNVAVSSISREFTRSGGLKIPGIGIAPNFSLPGHKNAPFWRSKGDVRVPGQEWILFKPKSHHDTVSIIEITQSTASIISHTARSIRSIFIEVGGIKGRQYFNISLFGTTVLHIASVCDLKCAEEKWDEINDSVCKIVFQPPGLEQLVGCTNLSGVPLSCKDGIRCEPAVDDEFPDSLTMSGLDWRWNGVVEESPWPRQPSFAAVAIPSSEPKSKRRVAIMFPNTTANGLYTRMRSSNDTCGRPAYQHVTVQQNTVMYMWWYDCPDRISGTDAGWYISLLLPAKCCDQREVGVIAWLSHMHPGRFDAGAKDAQFVRIIEPSRDVTADKGQTISRTWKVFDETGGTTEVREARTGKVDADALVTAFSNERYPDSLILGGLNCSLIAEHSFHHGLTQCRSEKQFNSQFTRICDRWANGRAIYRGTIGNVETFCLIWVPGYSNDTVSRWQLTIGTFEMLLKSSEKSIEVAYLESHDGRPPNEVQATRLSNWVYGTPARSEMPAGSMRSDEVTRIEIDQEPLKPSCYSVSDLSTTINSLPTTNSISTVIIVAVVLSIGILVAVVLLRRHRHHLTSKNNAVLDEYATVVLRRSWALFIRKYENLNPGQADSTDFSEQSLGNLRIPAKRLAAIREVSKGLWSVKICMPPPFESDREVNRSLGWPMKSRSAAGELIRVNAIRATSMDLDSCIALLTEAQLLLALAHQHVIPVVGFTIDVSPAVLLLNALDCRTLRSHLQDLRRSEAGSGLISSELLRVCASVASALEFLQLRQVAHCSISASAVFVNPSLNEVRLGRFDKCRSTVRADYYLEIAKPPDLSSNSVRWLAPELLMVPGQAVCGGFGHATDVWAFGVLVWEVFTGGRKPYGKLDNAAVAEVARGGKTAELLDQFLEPESISGRGWSTVCPCSIRRMLGKCWQLNARVRPSFSVLHTTLRIELLPAEVSMELVAAAEGATEPSKYANIRRVSHWTGNPDSSGINVALMSDRHDLAHVSSRTKFKLPGAHRNKGGKLALDVKEWSVPRVAIAPINKLGEGEFGEVMLVALTENPGLAPMAQRRIDQACMEGGTTRTVFAAGKTLHIQSKGSGAGKYSYFTSVVETAVDDATDTSEQMKEFFDEAAVMQMMDHPNLVVCLCVRPS